MKFAAVPSLISAQRERRSEEESKVLLVFSSVQNEKANELTG